METQNTYIIYLLHKYINSQCTEQELKQLLEWLKYTDDYACFDKVGKALWADINQTTAYPNNNRVQELQVEVSNLLKQITPQNSPQIIKYQPLHKSLWFTIAAVTIMAICMTFSIIYFYNTNSTNISYTEIITHKGEQKVYHLSDGSKVTLNSDSKLLIPDDFNEKNRNILMKREGFFEVTKNPKKPFVIKTNDTQVEVLGTSFNVKAYEEDDLLSITVSTGKVLVKVASQDLQLSLTPNQHLTVDNKRRTINKETFIENDYIKWMNGILYFHKTPIKEVIKTIERTYNTKIILNCKNCNQIITGTHDNKSLKAVIDAVCFTTGLRSQQKGDKIIIY